jgi:hypothetical protein
MWLIPANLKDAPLLFDWSQDERRWLEAALPEAAHWRSNKRRLKRSLSKPQRIFIASEPRTSTDRHRRMVGLLVIEDGSKVRWAVHPEEDRQAVATKMLKLVVEPGFSATVNRDEEEVQKILAAAGFDLLADGDRQLWRADRVPGWI